jgi:hypothetical protein
MNFMKFCAFSLVRDSTELFPPRGLFQSGAGLFGMILALCLFPLSSQAQSRWILSYQGTETSSGSSKLSTVTVTEKTLIERCATNAGVSTNHLALVLHFNGDGASDTFEVVNINDPNLFRCEVFRFAFSEFYTHNAGSVLKRIAYLYDSTSGHSRGSAVINRRVATKGREAGMPVVDGKIHYWLGVWHETESDPNAIVGSGTFKATGPLNAL